jgi:hypothetical protein
MTIIISLGAIVHFLFWAAVVCGSVFLVGAVFYWSVALALVLVGKVNRLTTSYPVACLGALVAVISFVTVSSLMP